MPLGRRRVVYTAVPAGAAVAIGVMAHAMFVRAPQPASSTAAADAATCASDAIGSDVVGPDAIGSESDSEPAPDAGSSRYGSGTGSVAGGD